MEEALAAWLRAQIERIERSAASNRNREQRDPVALNKASF